ncbi:MAG: adenine deaminase [Solobacterium sp.]|nr:adenine deaminase [Solobacterium sp.]
MYRIQPRSRAELSLAASGQITCDLVLLNTRIVNVFTGEILPGAIYLYDGFIAHVDYEHPYEKTQPAETEEDLNGRYVTPGLIDAHMHIESSMLKPQEFARTVLPLGTTTVITDPHEIGNVMGVRGVEYMIRMSEDLPMRQLINIPSCVPAVPGREFSGADFLAYEIKTLARYDRTPGLAEIMDYMAVINGEKRMGDILDAAEDAGLYLQGHCPRVSGNLLSAYLAGGPMTDHESTLAEEAIEKYRQGMFVDIKESSFGRNVKTLTEALSKFRFHDRMCFCTDDIEPGDLIHQGHLNYVAMRAIQSGMDPVDVIRCCTINVAREAGINRLGAIAPGYAADLNVYDLLEELKPYCVYYAGDKVAEQGRLTVEIGRFQDPIEQENTVNLPELSVERLRLTAPKAEGTVSVNVIDFGNPTSGISKQKTYEFPVQDHTLIFPDDTFQYAAVINRHGKNHVSLAVVRHIGLRRGAIATTVSHDSHNMTVVYQKPEDALLAVEALKECRGGMCAVCDGTVLSLLPLPIAGLIYDGTCDEAAQAAEEMKKADRMLGLTEIENPLLRCASIALPVVPEIRLTDLGMVEVATKKFVPVFPDH